MIVSQHRLDEVCDITMGQAPEGASYNRSGVGIPLIAGAGDFDEVRPVAKKFTTAPGKTCLPGDIVLGIRASIGERVIADREYCLGRGVAGLRPHRAIDSRYLWHWLDHSASALAAKAKGATFKQVNREDIAELRIGVPPIAEQRRIAEILDKADTLRTKRRAALAQLEIVRQAIFVDMFGDLATNPKGWSTAAFPEVIYFQEGPGVRNWQFRTDGVKLINVKNIVHGNLVVENTARFLALDEVEQRYKHFLLEAGDLVVASSGVTWGKVAEVRANDLPLCLNTSMIRLRPLAAQIEKSYLRAFIESQSFRRQILRLITGSAQPNFGPAHLRQLGVPLPPLATQRKYGACVEAVDRLRQTQTAAVPRVDAVFASLQHRAFRGEL